MLVPSAELAAARVWVEVFGCYEEFPEFGSFAARPGLRGDWIVEGRAGVIVYGLWEVEDVTGEITALDDRALQAKARQDGGSCTGGEGPTVITEQQAEILVWVAAYDCWPPSLIPALDAFTATQESPHRWVVEGRAIFTDPVTDEVLGLFLFGLWLVDTDTAQINGLDQLARDTRALSCFEELS